MACRGFQWQTFVWLALMASLAGCRHAQVVSRNPPDDVDQAPTADPQDSTNGDARGLTPPAPNEVIALGARGSTKGSARGLTPPAQKGSLADRPAGEISLTTHLQDEPAVSDAASESNRGAKSSAETDATPPGMGLLAADASEMSVSFNEAIYAGLSSHPTIGAALEAIQQSEGDFVQSSLLPNPMLMADVLMLPLGQRFSPSRQGGPTQQDAFVSYPIDWFLFGKRTSAMLANRYAVNVNQLNYQDLLRTRIEVVSREFFNVVEAQALEELARANLDNLTEVQLTTQRAVDVGKRPEVELNRIRLDVVNARQELTRAHANTLSAAAALRSVSGWGGSPLPLKAVWDLATPLQSDALPLEQSISVAEAERPDLESLRWQIAKTGADVTAAERAGRPTVLPALGWTYQYQREIQQSDVNSWNASVTMSVPIFDRNQGNVLKAEAAQRQTQWQYQARLLEVKAEVQQALAELQMAEQNANAVADEQLKLAIKVRDTIIEAYGIGARPLIDVLDAQRNYRETYRLYITTRAAFWTALYRYRAAVGKQTFDHE